MQIGIVTIVLLALGVLTFVGAVLAGGPAGGLLAVLGIALLLSGVLAEATD